MPMKVRSNLSCSYLYTYLLTHPLSSSIKLIAAQFINQGTLKTQPRTSYSCCKGWNSIGGRDAAHRWSSLWCSNSVDKLHRIWI